MDKKVIGYKIEVNIALAILMVIGGIALAAGGVLFFLFVMAGAVGGAVAGGTIACGVMLVTMGIASKTLPNELVHIDDTVLYLHSKAVDLKQIQKVSFNGKALTVYLANNKKIQQGFIKNCAECASSIQEQLKEPSAK